MNENRSFASSFWRISLPLLVAAAVLIATVLISGSALIRIEDVNVNRVLAGTFGSPDWRVQEMNPLLAQLITVLYRAIPAVNWYGVLLLGLLMCSAAAAIGLSSHKKSGFLPAAIVVAPLLLILTNSLQSTVVCALCAATGAFLLMDGLKQPKSAKGRIIVGALLFLSAAMLSLCLAVVIAVAAAICFLPFALRESRIKGLALGALAMAVFSLALYGYSALMYNAPELSAYRANASLYERLQHSSLKEETETLLSQYGSALYLEGGHEEHDHDGDGEADGEHEHESDISIPTNSFDSVGWSLNDASLFFTRYGTDSTLTDPETLRTLSKEASYLNTNVGSLLSDLFTTVKKPQFLLLLAMLAVTAMGVVITSRRKGLTALLAVLFALCGHIVTLMRYYDSFADIAPYYLFAIVALLYRFDAEDAKAWFQRAFKPFLLRVGLASLTLLFFAAGMAGLFYYTSITPANVNIYTAEAVQLLKPYITSHPDMLFIGDNPNDRFRPQTLDVPVRGEDQNLLAGTYDLYSPRATALMEKYSLTNPLKDSLGREDIGYINMTYINVIFSRVVEGYDTYLKTTELFSQTPYAEQILSLSAFTQQEVDAALEQQRYEEEQAALWAEALADLEAQGLLTDEEHYEGDGHDHDADELATPTASVEPTETATTAPSVAPSPGA